MSNPLSVAPEYREPLQGAGSRPSPEEIAKMRSTDVDTTGGLVDALQQIIIARERQAVPMSNTIQTPLGEPMPPNVEPKVLNWLSQPYNFVRDPAPYHRTPNGNQLNSPFGNSFSK